VVLALLKTLEALGVPCPFDASSHEELQVAPLKEVSALDLDGAQLAGLLHFPELLSVEQLGIGDHDFLSRHAAQLSMSWRRELTEHWVIAVSVFFLKNKNEPASV